MEVRFVVVAPPPARKSYKVRLPIVVGRGDEAKFRIQQDSVSRRHCEFSSDHGIVMVTDFGSTNGTQVDGRKIDPGVATAVSSGAEVRIGATVLRVEYAAAGVPLGSTVTHHDTVPLAIATNPETESATQVPDIESSSVDAPPASTEPEAPAFPDVAAAEAAPVDAAFPDVDPAPEPPAEGGFDFLSGGAEPPPAADDKLDDFFKSLS